MPAEKTEAAAAFQEIFHPPFCRRAPCALPSPARLAAARFTARYAATQVQYTAAARSDEHRQKRCRCLRARAALPLSVSNATAEG